ncbi:MAG: hypothetical protein ABJP87_14820, partial [Bauldia litoralis]|uniref:hypothetical protein n=1 Tax=Bauldia litoralis TaxID=665467 RepID=UPI003296FACC
MAMTDTAPLAKADIELARRRQKKINGVILLCLAAFVALAFGATSEGDAVFRLTLPRDAVKIPNLVLPAAPYAYIVAALLAFFGIRQFLRGGGRPCKEGG